MRRALAVLAVVALTAVGAWAYTRPAGPVTTASPSPTATTAATPTATMAAASPTPTTTPAATPTGTPIPYGPPAVGGSVTVRGAAASLPGSDFRYIVTGQGTGMTYWVVLLDLGAKRAQTVAQVDVVVPAGSQSAPWVAVDATASGDRVMIVTTEPAGRTNIFMLEVQPGTVRAIWSLPDHAQAILSPDGSRFAFSDRSSEGGRNGVWVGTTADGSHRQLVADDPQRVSSPPIPQSFSPDGKLLALGLSFGLDSGDVLAIIPSDAPATRVDAQARTIAGATMLEPGGIVDWLGAPGDVWVWQGRAVHFGVNAINRFDLATSRRTPVYAPAGDLILHHVARHPARDRFATHEAEMSRDGAIWVRTPQGAATKIADTTEAGPHSPWWSADGSKLYAFRGGDDSVGSVVELLSGEGIVTYCLREATGLWDCV